MYFNTNSYVIKCLVSVRKRLSDVILTYLQNHNVVCNYIASLNGIKHLFLSCMYLKFLFFNTIKSLHKYTHMYMWSIFRPGRVIFVFLVNANKRIYIVMFYSCPCNVQHPPRSIVRDRKQEVFRWQESLCSYYLWFTFWGCL